MRALSTAELLTVWELGTTQLPSQRALTLLAAACADETSPEQIAQLSLGRRDQRLLALRERTFGPQLTGLSTCPACQETLEFEVAAHDLSVSGSAEAIETLEVRADDYEICFRLPNSFDLTSLDPNRPNESNRRKLLARCVLTARLAGADISADQLPEKAVATIAARMDEADPQADVQLALACPACGESWSASFEIVSFFWSEIHAWATRLLRDIHLLASAYGWSEADLLAMNPTRRQAYLELNRG